MSPGKSFIVTRAYKPGVPRNRNDSRISQSGFLVQVVEDQMIKRPTLIERPEFHLRRESYSAPGLYVYKDVDGWWMMAIVTDALSVSTALIVKQEDFPTELLDEGGEGI